MANDNIVSSSKKIIYNKLLDIAQKYTDTTNTDYLKTGLFGYITEALAAEMKDSAFHKEMLYNEMFLNTAVMPQSVYNWAKMFNIEINSATPAYANIIIKISTDEIESYLNQSYPEFDSYGDVPSTSGNFLILDRNDPIIAGDYYFSLEHSILIKKLGNGFYQAQYILNEPLATSYQTITNKTLLITTSDNEIRISARAYQYKMTKISRYINSTSFLSKIQRYDFENQFADAKLFYELPGGTEEEIKLKYSNISSDSIVSGEKYAYYNLNNSNQLEINFKIGDSNFLPVGNSKINLYLYTTNGGQAPSKFAGDAFINISRDELKTLPVRVEFEDSLIIGGSDAPDLSTIKETIINKISTRDTIITESDLNTYFKILTGLIEDINSGKVTFIKRRDDLLRRIFSAYILLRDGRDENDETVTDSSYISKCIPTTTADVLFTGITDNTELNQKIVYSPTTGAYTANNQYSGDDYYFSPFYMYLFLSPVTKIRYIYNLTDDTVNAILSEIPSDYSVTPLSFNLYRGINGNRRDDSYQLTLTFVSNSEITDITKAAISINNLNGLTDISVDNDSLTYEYDNENNVYNYTFKTNIAVNSTEFNMSSSDSSDYGSNIQLSNYSSGIPDISPVSVGFKNSSGTVVFSFVTESNNKKNANGDTQSGLQFFRSLDDIMLSDIKIKEITEEDVQKYNITVTDVPLIHSSYASNSSGTSKHEYFIKQLFNYANILKENLEKLETSTTFDLKFYNTYGPSKLYSSLTTNLKLELQIQMVSGISSDNREALEKEIISYIRKYVDSCNSDRIFYVSNLISKLQDSGTYGSYIAGILFLGLNDTYSQSITAVEANAPEKTGYPVEWFNLDKAYLKRGTVERSIKFTYPD